MFIRLHQNLTFENHQFTHEYDSNFEYENKINSNQANATLISKTPDLNNIRAYNIHYRPPY